MIIDVLSTNQRITQEKTNRDVQSQGAYTDGVPWSWITQVQKLLKRLHKRTKKHYYKLLEGTRENGRRRRRTVPEMAGVRSPSPITIQVPRRTRINKAV